MKTEIFINKINKETNEIIETIGPECNDINWYNLVSTFVLNDGGTYSSNAPMYTPATGSPVYVWSMLFATSDFIQDRYTSTFYATLSSIINTGYPAYTPKSIPSEMDKITFIASLNPPSSGSRTIYGLGLKPYTWHNHVDTNATFSNLRLTTPCVQDSNTVLQVTYRIYLDDYAPQPSDTNIADGVYAYIRQVLTILSGGSSSPLANAGSNSYTHSVYGMAESSCFYEYNTTQYKPAGIATGSSSGGGAEPVMKTTDLGLSEYNTSAKIKINGNTYQMVNTRPYTDVVSSGTFFRNIVSFGSQYSTDQGYIAIGSGTSTWYISELPHAYQRAVPTNSSPIQNIFKQTASASGPFQDLSALSSMTGVVNFNYSTWVTQPFPKLVKILITGDGTSSTATYKFETLTFTGGFTQNTFSPKDAILPQDGHNYTGMNYIKHNTNDRQLFDDVITGGTTIRTPDGSKYFVTASGKRTRDGIALYNIETGDKTIIDLTYISPMAVTAVSDLEVVYGQTYVTCANTGLWKISSDFLTVTHLTNLSGGPNDPSIDTSKAYHIEVTANNTIWVLFEGGLCKGVSADSGATWTWTVYNSTTSPALTITGVNSPTANWSNVTTMSVDPLDVNGKFLFVLGVPPTTTNTNASGFVWWRADTGTTTVMSTGLTIASSHTFALLLARSDNFRCINGVWSIQPGVESTSASTYDMRRATYGASTWSTTTFSFRLAPRAIPATIAGVPGAIVGSSSVDDSGTTFKANRVPAVFITSTNFASLPASIATVSSSPIEFSLRHSAMDTTTTNQASYANELQIANCAHPVVYLPNSNMVISWVAGLRRFGVAPIVVPTSAANYSTYRSAFWKTYGWNSGTSSWEIGNSNSKTCHPTLANLIDGLQISFTDGASSPHFTNTHQFITTVGNGVMKDNATDYNHTFNVYMNSTQPILDLYAVGTGVSATVPRGYAGTFLDWPVGFSTVTPNTANTSLRKLQIRKGNVVGLSNTTATIVIGDQKLPANSEFTIKFKLHSLAPVVSSNLFRFGLVTWSGAAYSSPVIDISATTTANLYDFRVGGSTIGSFTISSVDDVISFTKTNENRILLKVNDILINGQTATTLSSDLYMYYFSDVGYYGVRDVTVSYFDSRRLMIMGNDSLLTGFWNPKFSSLTTSSNVGDAAFTVNSIAKTPITVSSAASVSTGEIKLLAGSASVIFDDLPTITVSTTGSTKGALLMPVMATTKSINKNVIIVNGGTGYTNGSHSLVFTGGGGSGAVGTATVSGGVVTAITISNGGTGYTSAPTITLAGTAGTPTLAATFTVYIGFEVASVSVISGGSGYTSAPTLTFSSPANGGVLATATANISASRSVNDVVTITRGSGYTDGVYALTFTGGGGTGASGNVHIAGGQVVRVEIISGGSGYTSAPTLSFTGAGAGTGAVLTAAIGYRILSVTMTNNGSGYIPDGDTAVTGYVKAHYSI